ncbi:MAG: carbohydrate kinase family protein [Anaerolineales bacterium]|nr:carbohydrate kinase family protein [Anaerolineales bacterium]
MTLALSGSIAYDYLMTFPGRFRDHILPERLDRLSLSFLVDSLERRRGGIATNIAYTLALLGERPLVVGTVGEDFDEYRAWLDSKGVDTSAIRTVPGLFTASFFVTTDTANSQIASFYTGAMARAGELRLGDLHPRPTLVVISANDPAAMEQHAEECLSLGIPYAYDPSQQVVRMDPATLAHGLHGCMAAFGNDYEFALIQEKTGLTPEALVQRAAFVAVTLGEAGADIYTRDGRIHVPAVPPRAIADPTGVGDAFRGGFLKGLVHGLALERCAQMGALAAAYCLETRGTQGHDFDLPAFVRRFRQHFDDQGDLDRLA